MDPVKFDLCLQYGIGHEGFVPRAVRPYSVVNDLREFVCFFGVARRKPDLDGQKCTLDVLARQYLFFYPLFLHICINTH